MTASDRLLVSNCLVSVWPLIGDFMKAIAETMMIDDSSAIDQQVAMCSDRSRSSICSARANKKLSSRHIIILSQEFKVFMHHDSHKNPRKRQDILVNMFYIY